MSTYDTEGRPDAAGRKRLFPDEMCFSFPSGRFWREIWDDLSSHLTVDDRLCV